MKSSKIIKEAKKRYGLKFTSGYRTQEEQNRIEQRSCHCHSFHLGPDRLPPDKHHPGCPMYHE